MSTPDQSVTSIEVAAYTVPTDAPESDGTLAWHETTIVVVHARSGAAWGLGYSYADAATAKLIETVLAPLVHGLDALSPEGAWNRMVGAIRNLGRPGICSMAIAAVDVALWDLKARLLQVPLCQLLGMLRESVPIYGSGGFTNYDRRQLTEQLSGWVERGIPRVKMKVGSEPQRDPLRVGYARHAIGPDAELFVDANGAYTVTQAVTLAEHFVEQGAVAWFEEPVSSDDLAGLRTVRERVPVGMQVAAGEYGYDLPYFERMLRAQAVDVQQADVTRCAGITELLRVDAVCRSHGRPLSLHCGPAVHAHVATALSQFIHLEYFHDHERIEEMLFDGVLDPREGALWPDLSATGMGLEFKQRDAEALIA
ncbi:MAG TPA: enolase C-terminal domain-like protein [Solirubrobacteraceae bacterium]|jgi:L-alanine-DL-glutamate epimerase-like enolase superfamily enzyme|nr:enolase C-terminal domain-like protein [Solirubrobacteraceae bacterium]